MIENESNQQKKVLAQESLLIENDVSEPDGAVHVGLNKLESEDKDNSLEFEELLNDYVGQCGIYQWAMVATVMLFHLFGAFNNLGIVFVAATPDHWCATPDLDNLNLTEDFVKNLSIPFSYGEYAQCEMYLRNYSGWTAQDVYECLASDCNNKMNLKIIPCAYGYSYSKEQYQSTVVSEFGLVCERQVLVSIQASIYMVGLLFGVFISGIMSDRYGRWPVTLISHIAMTIAMFGTGLSHNFILYLFMRFSCGVFSIASFTSAFILGVEMVGVRYRVHAVIIYQYYWALGIMVYAGCAYLIRSWDTLQLVTSVPSALMVLAFVFIPESPRWLYVKKRNAKADKIICKMARINRTNVPDLIILNVKTKKKGRFWEIFGSPNIRKRSLILCFLWFVVCAGYFMLSLGTNNLAGNNYLNFFISGVVELLAYSVSQITLSSIGRRISLSLPYFLGGVSLLAALAVPTDHTIITTVLSMTGKFGMTICFTALYVYTAELYPTSLRNVGIGTSGLFAKIGGIISPFISDIGRFAWWFPNAFIGALACIAGVITLLLPETKGKAIPDTIEEAETFGTKTRCKMANIFKADSKVSYGNKKAVKGNVTEASLLPPKKT